MSVLAGLIKSASTRFPTKNEDAIEELLSDLCYDALVGVAALDETPSVRFEGSYNVEIELVLVGLQDKDKVVSLLGKALSKYLIGYYIGIKDSPRGRLYVVIASNATIIRSLGCTAQELKASANVKASSLTLDDILDTRTKDIANGTQVTGYVWMGSGYKKSEVNFVIKGVDVYPASTNDYKILEKAWNTDRGIIDAIVEQANDSFEYAATAIQLITDTEQHTIVSQSQDADIYDLEDGDANFLGINKHGEECYLVLR